MERLKKLLCALWQATVSSAETLLRFGIHLYLEERKVKGDLYWAGGTSGLPVVMFHSTWTRKHDMGRGGMGFTGPARPSSQKHLERDGERLRLPI